MPDSPRSSTRTDRQMSRSLHSTKLHGGPAPPRHSRRGFLSTATLGAGAMPALLSAKEPEIPVRPPASTPPVPIPGERATTYATINRDSWATILADRGESYVPPVTVHLPIQPVHSRDFIHVDAALNVCRRRVLPKLSTSDGAGRKAAQEMETFVVQFALDDPPIVPDMRASRLSLAEGKYPLAHASYFASGLVEADPQESRAATLKHFQSQFTPEHAQLTFRAENWDKIFTEIQLSTLQLLVQFPGEQGLMPTQGGSSERHFVWVWEALFMLLPMLRLGHFEPVRRSLDFIFGLQDPGCPPEGELTTTAGAVGTTGPKWLNTTGSALALATDYYLYSRDTEFLKERPERTSSAPVRARLIAPQIRSKPGWIFFSLPVRIFRSIYATMRPMSPSVAQPNGISP